MVTCKFYYIKFRIFVESEFFNFQIFRFSVFRFSDFVHTFLHFSVLYFYNCKIRYWVSISSLPIVQVRPLFDQSWSVIVSRTSTFGGSVLHLLLCTDCVKTSIIPVDTLVHCVLSGAKHVKSSRERLSFSRLDAYQNKRVSKLTAGK